MMFCPKCGARMNKVMHFEKGENYQFNKCTNAKCNFESRKKKLIMSMFDSNK